MSSRERDRARRASTLKAARNHRTPWTPEQLETIAREDIDLTEMCRLTGRSYVAIENKRRQVRTEREFERMLEERGLL